LLLGGIPRPKRVIAGRAGLRPREEIVARLAELDEPEQELEAAPPHERIALEIEKEVARRGLGQALEPGPRLETDEELVQGTRLAATRHLEPRLSFEARERFGTDPVDGRSFGERGEGFDPCNARRRESLALLPRDARDEREVIVAAPSLLAPLP